MKHVSKFVLVALLGAAPMASANGLVDDSTNATANASNHTSVDTDVRNSANSSSHSSARQDQGQNQGQDQGQEQGISDVLSHNTTTVEAPDVKGMGRELAKHADSASRSQALSGGNVTPCGDASGMGGQGGLFGFSVGTVSETCKAFRLQQLEALDAERKNVPLSTRLAETTYFVGYLPRLVLHVASFGILN